MMYQACKIPGIQPQIVRMMLMMKWWSQPVLTAQARGGRTIARSPRQKPPCKELVRGNDARYNQCDIRRDPYRVFEGVKQVMGYWEYSLVCERNATI